MLGWWNEHKQRMEMVGAEVGDGTDETKLKPHTWYKVNDNRQIVEVDNE